MSTFRFHNTWGALGAMLALIALYLLLTRATGASRLMQAGGSSTVRVFRTLQGR
jgi:hypothetical protein